MRRRSRARRMHLGTLVGVGLATVLLAACSGEAATPAWTAAPVGPIVPKPGPQLVEVYRSPTCACCHEWEAYLRAHGWTVRSFESTDMASIKRDRGLPEETWSCHTAVVDGYVVEGHVPLAAIEDLLASRPDIDGIALPGMPPGSPGMAGVPEGPFQVLSISNGAVALFGAY